VRIEYIRYFIKVTQCHSILSAAKKLFISQSTLSSVIHSMESELGYQLLNRSAKGVELTEKGREALAHMQEISDGYDRILELNADYIIGKKESICICAYPCLCSYLSLELSKLILSERYSNTMLEVKDSLGLDNVINGSADITISHCAVEELPYYKRILRNLNYIIEELFEDKMCCYVNTDSEFARNDGIMQSELLSEHIVISQCCLKQIGITEFQEICGRLTVLNQPDTVRQAVVNGTSVGIAPGCSLIGNESSKDNEVFMVPIIDTPRKLAVFMIYRKNTSSIEKLLIQDLKRILKLF